MFQNADKMADVLAPVFISHGRSDEIIPVHHAERNHRHYIKGISKRVNSPLAATAMNNSELLILNGGHGLNERWCGVEPAFLKFITNVRNGWKTEMEKQEDD